MNAIFDVLRISTTTLLDCFCSPKKLSKRSWPTEYTFRLAKRMLHESINQPIPWLRERQKILKMYSPRMRQTTKKNEVISGVPCIIYTPVELHNPDIIIVYLHGGGYVVGSADGYSLTLATLALTSQAKVVGVEYRLTPEHPLPAAQDDCFAVVKLLLENKYYAKKKIILMGDSAGGGLCLATIHSLSKLLAIRQLTACVLLSPWLAPLGEGRLALENEQSDILDKALLDRWVSEFVVDAKSDAPLVDFREMDLAILPPLYIQAASAEVFIKQIMHFVNCLNAAKIVHRIDVFDQQFHVFQTFSPFVKQADEAFDKIADYIHSL